MKPLSLTSSLALALLIPGCATSYRLAPPSDSSLPPTDVVVSNEQHEIGIEIVNSQITTATGGGLLFALIDVAVDASRTNKASEAAAEVRDALIDFDYNEHFGTALAQRLSERMELTDGDGLRFVTKTEAGGIKQLVADSDNEVVCVIEPAYSLTPNFLCAKSSMIVTIYAKGTELKDRIAKAKRSSTNADVFYRNQFVATTRLPVSSGMALQTAASTIAEQPEVLKEALLTNMAELVDMMIYDFQTLDLQGESLGEKFELEGTNPSEMGTLIRRNENGRLWLRTYAKRLYSQG